MSKPRNSVTHDYGAKAPKQNPLNPSTHVLVAYLGSYKARGIIYSVHLYRLMEGLYHAKLRKVWPTGYVRDAVATRFYDEDESAITEELKRLEDLVLYDGAKLSEVEVIHSCIRPDDFLPAPTALDEWSAAVAKRAIQKAAET